MEVKIGANVSSLKSGLSEAQNSMQSFAAGAAKVGAALGLSFALFKIQGFAKESMNLYRQQMIAEEMVATGIRTTGGAAKKSLEDLKTAASKLQTETIFGDEKILGEVTSQLLTFTNIAGKEFDRTQKAVVDVASRLATANGGVADLTGTAIMLGKAMNDPIKGLAAMARVGIQFNEGQKEQIKSMVESGNIMGAQKLMLTEIETQYGGSAAAVAKYSSGVQLSNKIGDLQEQIGGKLSKMFKSELTPALGKIIDFLALMMDNWKPVGDAMNSVKKPFKDLGILIDNFAKTLGIAGDSGNTAAGIMQVLAVAINVLMAPTKLAVNLYGLLVRLFTGIVEGLKSAYEWFENLGKRFAFMQPLVDAVNRKFQIIKATFEAFVGVVKDMLITLGLYTPIADKVNSNAGQMSQKILDANQKMHGLKSSSAEAAQTLQQLKDRLKELQDQQQKTSNRKEWMEIEKEIKAQQKLIAAIEGNTNSTKENNAAKQEHLGILGKLNAELSKQNAIIESADSQKEINDAYKRIEAINLEIELIKDRNIALLKPIGLNDGGTAAQNAPKSLALRPKMDLTAFKDDAGEMVEVSLETGQLMQDALTTSAEEIGKAIATGTNPFEAAFKGLINVLLDFSSNFGKALIAAGTGVEAAKKLTTSGIGAIAAGVLMVGSVALIKAAMSQPPALAEGGLATGATMAMVGEGRGTSMSNPEVIAPLDKLKGMIGNSAPVILESRISGQDILLSQRKTIENNRR